MPWRQSRASVSSWTLEGELRGLFQVEGDLTPPLRQAKVIGPTEGLRDLQTVEAWRAGGAETWVHVFDVVGTESTKRLIIKAFVSLGAGEGRLETLNERRSLLSARGVAVPRLYATGRGVVLEEHVPWLLRDHVRARLLTETRVVPLLVDLYLVAIAFDQLGFAPLSPFVDLRTEGTRVFVVDFGEDLGGPSTRRTSSAVSEVGPWLRSLGWRLPDAALGEALSEAESS